MTRSMDWQLDPAIGLRVPVLGLESAVDARRSLAHTATIESFALLQMLQREQQRDDDMFEHLFTTTIRRLVELNGAVCMAVGTGPGLDSPATIADMIFGVGGWRDSRNPGDTEPAAAISRRCADTADPVPAAVDVPLLADPARAEIVTEAGLGLFDKLQEMKEAIGSGGRGGRARQVWTAGFDALERRASVILSAATDEIESTAAIAERLAALPRVSTEEEREEQRAQSSIGSRS